MDEFSGQLFHFPIFFMVKWVLNERNILSEWQCVVCKPKSQQERFIVASIETTKQILAWFTSTRESGNLVENCNSNQLKDIEFFGNHDWEVVINLTIGVFNALLAKRKYGWIFRSTFPFFFFFTLKWILNQRNILSEWQFVVCKYLLDSLLQEKAEIWWKTVNQRFIIFWESWLRGGD